MNKECGKMSKMSKRAIPLLIVSLMILSFMPLMSVNAINPASLTIKDENYVLDDHGQYGDTQIVEGTGVTAGVDVNLYWDSVQAWDGEKGLLNSSAAKSSGAFEVWFDVPEAVKGDHYLWVKDTNTLDTEVCPTFWVDEKIKLSPSSGLENDKVTIKGYGFDDEADIIRVLWNWPGYAPITTLSPTTPETDELGSWTATFKVPTGYGYSPPDYLVYAEDEKGNTATKAFTIGAAISFDVEEGPVGTVVEISGRGFTKLPSPGTITQGDVTLDDDGTIIPCYLIDDVTIQTNGEFDAEIVIPQVSDEDDYEITVIDSGGLSATESFEVTGLAKVKVDPEYGVQGTKIDVEGFNFTQISGEEVSVEVWDTYPTGTMEYEKTFETDSDGEFSGTFTVPAASSGNYVVVARQIDHPTNIWDDTSFRIGMIIVILSKTSGPSGAMVTMSGTGFTPGSDNWNATFGGEELIDTGDVDTDGDLSLEGTIPSFFVPTVDPGSYIITVLDIEEEIYVDVEFEVTATTEAWTDPLVAPNLYNVSIEGRYFAEEAGVDLTFVLFNVTADGEVDED